MADPDLRRHLVHHRDDTHPTAADWAERLARALREPLSDSKLDALNRS